MEEEEEEEEEVAEDGLPRADDLHRTKTEGGRRLAEAEVVSSAGLKLQEKYGKSQVPDREEQID